MSISQKRIAEIAAMRDDEIDLSDIPELGEDFFANAQLRRMTPKKRNDDSSEQPAHQRIPAVSMNYEQTGRSTSSNELGMRPMQERAYDKRGEQYLLIKSPPASGKSRALMFIALDKINNQGIQKAIIVVPEKTIGASFANESLLKYGFYWDWVVVPQWNLCDAPGRDKGKVRSVKAFLDSDDKILVCTHATFRFAVAEIGLAAFDDCLLAIDEFHHVSANPDNVLGAHLGEFIARDKVHIVAMTGSYFRGDAEAVLQPEDEAKFETVTYTYYEQLNGYQYLKTLDIGYYFYSGGDYTKAISKVLNPSEKTIVHIPRPMARESQGNKYTEAEDIYAALGTWEGTDKETGFQLIRTDKDKLLKVADLVDDGPNREKVSTALREPRVNNDRDFVDVIIALAMAREGFDWIWCEHALTVGYRSSLTEIVQIIGRTTRDAVDKTRARFTNLIAEPDASEDAVTDAVNDTIKAIAASLLMEQVLTPKFEFKAKTPDSGPQEGFDYGKQGYDPNGSNIGFNQQTGQFQIEIKGLVEPKSKDAKRICQEDLNELIAPFVQDKSILERGLFDEDIVPEELTLIKMGKIVKDKYPDLDDEDREAVRQHAIAALAISQQAAHVAKEYPSGTDGVEGAGTEGEKASVNTAILDGVRRFAMDVRELEIDLIDRINPFSAAYTIVAKSMNAERLKQIKAEISKKKMKLTVEEARELVKRALQFKLDRGRLPEITSTDPWECRMAEGVAFLQREEMKRNREETND